MQTRAAVLAVVSGVERAVVVEVNNFKNQKNHKKRLVVDKRRRIPIIIKVFGNNYYVRICIIKE